MSIDVPDYTWWFRERPVDTRHYYFSGNIGALTTIIVLDAVRHDLQIDYLELGTDYIDMILGLYVYNSAGVISANIAVPLRDGSAIGVISPNIVHVHNNSWFDELIYDAVNNYYKIALTRSIRAAYGLQVRVYNNNAGVKNIAFAMNVLDRGVLP
jgi:hypothetical protein